MAAQSIGDLIRPIMARCASLGHVHAWLRSDEDPARRKTKIMQLRQWGWISSEDATLLLEAYQLETA